VSEVRLFKIAGWVAWVAMVSFLAVTDAEPDPRLFGLFSFWSLLVAVAAVGSAFSTGNDWPKGTGRRRAAASAPTLDPTDRVGWSWMRVTYAYEVISVGLMMWLATAFVVGGAVYLASGATISGKASLLVAGITSPVAVPWPVKRWPPPMSSAVTLVPVFTKRLLIVIVISTSVLVVAVTIERLRVFDTFTYPPAWWDWNRCSRGCCHRLDGSLPAATSVTF